ncbi:MAG: hypothetical protein QXV23_04970 [Candidatus Bathyarchaeia archaeon]
MPIGVEYEVVLKKDGKTVRNRKRVEYVTFGLMTREIVRRKLGINVSMEGDYGKTPPRMEIKPDRPVESVDEAVNVFKAAVDILKELGYDVDLEGARRGSIHVTLDVYGGGWEAYEKLAVNTLLEPLVIASTGKPSKTIGGSLRVATYPTVKPGLKIFHPDPEHEVIYAPTNMEGYYMGAIKREYCRMLEEKGEIDKAEKCRREIERELSR